MCRCATCISIYNIRWTDRDRCIDIDININDHHWIHLCLFSYVTELVLPALLSLEACVLVMSRRDREGHKRAQENDKNEHTWI